MVEHRKPVARNTIDKVLFPFKPLEESVIKEFVPLDELFSILNSKGEPFEILNQGIRDLMVRRAISYDLDGLHAPLRGPRPIRVTRMAFLAAKDEKRSQFLIVETASYRYKIEEGGYDPKVGDIRIFNLIKKNENNSEPPINEYDQLTLDDDYILLTRRNVGGTKVHESGHAVLPSLGRDYTEQRIYNGEEVLNILKEWVGQAIK